MQFGTFATYATCVKMSTPAVSPVNRIHFRQSGNRLEHSCRNEHAGTGNCRRRSDQRGTCYRTQLYPGASNEGMRILDRGISGQMRILGLQSEGNDMLVHGCNYLR
jgi:hypothetical protein